MTRLLTASLFLFPSVAAAHVALTDPVPRSGDNGLTMEPCGGVAAGAPTALTAGDTITVSWAVGQPHGGALTIDFSAADDMNFDTYVLATDISDEAGMPTSMDVELPNIDCEACTLRLVQINPDAEEYYSCADVSLSGASSDSSGSGSSGGPAESSGGGSSDGGPADSSTGGDTGGDSSTGGSASATTTNATTTSTATATAGDGSGGTDTGGGNEDTESSGCSCSTGATPATWLLFAVVGLSLRRPRASRRPRSAV